jgi:hypothetical protein
MLIVKNQKNRNKPGMKERKKMYLYTVEYYSSMKKNEIMVMQENR